MKIKIKQFLHNIDGPKHPLETPLYLTFGVTPENHFNYLSDKIIGKPQGTSRYSSQQLEKEGMVGVYKEMGLREWLSYRVMLINHWYNEKNYLYEVQDRDKIYDRTKIACFFL